MLIQWHGTADGREQRPTKCRITLVPPAAAAARRGAADGTHLASDVHRRAQGAPEEVAVEDLTETVYFDSHFGWHLRPVAHLWYCEDRAGMASSAASVPAALGDDPQATAAAEELLRAMESYQPIVPDAVTQYYLGLSGYQCNDPRVTRLASLAAHKFVADLTNDALRICKQNKQKGRLTLTTEDLIQSAREYGIYIRKPMYFAGT